LGACGWVTAFERFHLPVYSDVVVCGTWFVGWVDVSSQFECLPNGSDGVLYGAGFDLLTSADVTSSDPFDEGLKYGNLFFVM